MAKTWHFNKKGIAILLGKTALTVGLTVGAISFLFAPKESTHGFYRPCGSGANKGTEYVIHSTQFATYNGNNFVTNDGNIWEVSGIYEQGKYLLTISDEATPDFIEDDIVLDVRKVGK